MSEYIAGEKLEMGDMIRIGEDGKAYRFAMTPHGEEHKNTLDMLNKHEKQIKKLFARLDETDRRVQNIIDSHNYIKPDNYGDILICDRLSQLVKDMSLKTGYNTSHVREVMKSILTY